MGLRKSWASHVQCTSLGMHSIYARPGMPWIFDASPAARGVNLNSDEVKLRITKDCRDSGENNEIRHPRSFTSTKPNPVDPGRRKSKVMNQPWTARIIRPGFGAGHTVHISGNAVKFT